MLLTRRDCLVLGVGAAAAFLAELRKARAENFRSYPVTLTTTSAQILGAGTANRRRLVFINASKTANVAFCPATRGDNSQPLAAVLFGAGSIPLLPLTGYMIDGTGPPVLDISVAFNGISDTNGSQMTILDYYG